MKVFSGSHAARAGSVALLGAALLVLPMLPGGTATAQETTADKCAETLKENYGVVETGDVNQQDGTSRRSVYADGTTASGETVRFRCLHAGRETPEVQVYAEPEPGSARDWADWGPADEYRVEAEPEAESEAEPEAEADEGQPNQPEQESEQAEQESGEASGEASGEVSGEASGEATEEAPGPKRVRPPEDDAS